MHYFTDTKGHKWSIEISMATVRRVHAALKIDLCAMASPGGEKLSEVFGNLMTFVDVLYVTCEEECNQRGVTDEAFARVLGGDALNAAQDAWLEALIDFFPEPQARANLRKVKAKLQAVIQLILDQADQKLAALDDAAILKQLRASSGLSLADSASTPSPVPSAS